MHSVMYTGGAFDTPTQSTIIPVVRTVAHKCTVTIPTLKCLVFWKEKHARDICGLSQR